METPETHHNIPGLISECLCAFLDALNAAVFFEQREDCGHRPMAVTASTEATGAADSEEILRSTSSNPC
jgi:hypothetical protein